MKKQLLMGLGICTLALGGVAAIIGNQNVSAVEVSAGENDKSITVYLHSDWRFNCHIAAYLYDGDSHNTWTNYATVDGDTKVTLTYTASWTPTKISLMRYDNAYSQASWENDRWDSSVWNQAKDMNYASAFYGGGGNWMLSCVPTLNGQTTSGGSWGDLVSLDQIKLNPSNHWEFYSNSVSFGQNIRFKSKWDNSWSGKFTTSEYVSGFSGDQSNDITCANAGTYAVFYDTETQSIAINDQNHAAADDYAQKFLTATSVCDGNGAINNITSEIWTAQKTAYTNLANDTIRGYVNGATANVSGNDLGKMAARYDYIVGKYGTSVFEDFMGRNPAKPSSGLFVAESSVKQEAPIAITVIAASAIAFAAFFFLRKKKEQ